MSNNKDIKRYNYEVFQYICDLLKTNANQVHKSTGIATATFANWKKGVYEPKEDKINLIAEHFHISPDYFKCPRLDDIKETLDIIVPKANPLNIDIEMTDNTKQLINSQQRLKAYAVGISNMAILDKIAQDSEFMEHIAMLFSLDEATQKVIFRMIKTEYDEYLRKKENYSVG